MFGVYVVAAGAAGAADFDAQDYSKEENEQKGENCSISRRKQCPLLSCPSAVEQYLQRLRRDSSGPDDDRRRLACSSHAAFRDDWLLLRALSSVEFAGGHPEPRPIRRSPSNEQQGSGTMGSEVVDSSLSLSLSN